MSESEVYFLQMKMSFTVVGGHKILRFENELSQEVAVDMEGPIKIGVSTNVGLRQRTFDEHSPWPVELIGSIPGGYELEGELHKRFADYRIRYNREWFYPNTELLEFIRRSMSRVRHGRRKTRAAKPGGKKEGDHVVPFFIGIIWLIT